jgi:hypothetical protein
MTDPGIRMAGRRARPATAASADRRDNRRHDTFPQTLATCAPAREA